MEYLFTKGNLKVFETFGQVKTLVAFDYDGTLAPIVSVPNLAKMKSTTEDLFRELCSVRPIAIISGRSLKDMGQLLTVKPKYLIGNHGAEWESSNLGSSNLEDLWSRTKAHIQDILDHHPDLGISIEDKGFSLSLHYRNSPDHFKAETLLLDLTSNLSGHIRIIPGKFVFNLVAEHSANKYSALIEILELEECEFGLYFGDDDTDEDVFKNINSNILTVRIGRNEHSKAKFYLKDQEEIEDVLRLLIKASTK